MPVATSSVKKFRKQGKTRYEPIWDLYRDGVTQGSITKFLECREQFRLRYVFGWQSKARSGTTAFGSAFHAILAEIQVRGISIEKAVNRYLRSLGDLAPSARESVTLMLAEISLILELYLDHWLKDHKRWNFIAREYEFETKHEVPIVVRNQIGEYSGGDFIPIRGVYDGVFSTVKRKGKLLETKTKGRIDESAIQSSLPHDIQTQLYLTTLRQYSGEKGNPFTGIETDEVCYDVIRNPQLRLSKGESIRDYLKRLRADIERRSSWYFMRWNVTLLPGDTDRWVERFLNPVLAQMVAWWESIKHDPNNPWGSPHHFCNPNAFQNQYGRSELFGALTTEKYFDLERRSVPYPECGYRSAD